MYKRGQITIFIIIGILILGAVAGSIYLVKNFSQDALEAEDKKEVGSETASIKLFVENCIKKTIEEGIHHIGLRGGYYEIINTDYITKTENKLIKIPFYLDQGKVNSPTKTEIEQELSKYIEKNLLSCTNFKSFEKQGYVIEKGNISANTILDKKINVDVKFPLKITSGSETQNLEKFTKTVNYDFLEKYNIINDFLYEQKKDTEWFSFGKILDLSDENDFDYEFQFQNSTIIVDFIFTDYLKEPFIYSFSLKYGWDDLTNIIENVEDVESGEEEYVEIIIPLDNYTIKKPNTFGTMIYASGGSITFSDNCDKLSIDQERWTKDGWLEFKTTSLQIGTYTCNITATNKLGDSDTGVFEVKII